MKCGPFQINAADDPNDTIACACLVIHKCDDAAEDDTHEWEFVVHDENDDGICEFLFWEDE